MPPEILISVIDDDPSLRRAIVRLVRSLGFTASAHETAEAFLATDEARTARCVIADVQLPGMSGVELKAMLDCGEHPAPMILVTAVSDSTVLARAGASGASCLLRKPFEAADMIACLKTAMGVGNSGGGRESA